MCGPAFDPIATLALPTAKIAVMGPEAAVNAVYANKIAEITDPGERAAFVAERRVEYEADVDLYRLASELVIDAVVPFESLRDELFSRFAAADPTDRQAVAKHHAVHMG
jgi:acetyl-CoA carboxylase carboxyltransferase component